MRINDEISTPVIVQSADLAWVPSPAAGVERRMLYRVGEEVARATSIVRYAPGSQFPRHSHNGGEEILVLEGVFQDEHGDYPAGSYFRNPPGTSHVPGSADGCTIFVRLWQFRQDDHDQVVRLPQGHFAEPASPTAAAALMLFDDGHEQVWLEDWAAGDTVSLPNDRGLELLLLSGQLDLLGQILKPQAWARLPAGVPLEAVIGPQGARVWIKDAPAVHPDVLVLPQ